MTVKLLLIYLLVIAFSLVLLFISISGGKNLRRNEDILAGRFSEVNEADAANKNKTKQQIELELLLINNNPLLKVLGIIDKNIKLKLALMVLVFFVYYLFFGRDTDGFSLVISCVLIFIGIIIVPGFLTGFVLKSKTKKIMNDESLKISATAVRVPVQGGHSESVNIEFDKDFDLEEVKFILANTSGIILQDDVSQKQYPMPFYCEGKDEVFVGRIRRDYSQPNTLNCWIVADNLRKGAATNAVQIAEYLVENQLV